MQRVRAASVSVDGEVIARIGPGLLILLAVRRGDGPGEAAWLAEKCAHLRIFPDGAQHMNRSLRETAGKALVVSQFTLYGDCRRGRRPSFVEAAPPAAAEPLYEAFVGELSATGVQVETGRFAARMEVELVNDGPVTVLVETPW